jgi:acetoacetate decarboxylase
VKLAAVVASPEMPLGVPLSPPRDTRFDDMDSLTITYVTDPESLREVVPEPLEIDPQRPLARIQILHMGDPEGYGPYNEATQYIPVTYQGAHGDFCRMLFLDNVAPILAGRERSAFPKLGGRPGLMTEDGALVGTLDKGTQRVVTATMAYKWAPMPKDDAMAALLEPVYFVKTVRDVETGHPISIRLVRAQMHDVQLKGAWTGPGRLQLLEHVLAPFADLPVRKIVSANHIVADMRLGLVSPVFDYLKK